jgi:hypothetical protein
LGSRFDAFDQQGIAPIAYALFAVTLGIAVGSFFKRVLPAIATTLGVFVLARAAVGVYLRPHYLAPVGLISQGLVGPSGHFLKGGLVPKDLPIACRDVLATNKGSLVPCLTSHGFSNQFIFQPASRFWEFQGIESALFLILAAGLIALAYWRVLGRDA